MSEELYVCSTYLPRRTHINFFYFANTVIASPPGKSFNISFVHTEGKKAVGDHPISGFQLTATYDNTIDEVRTVY